MGHWGGHRPGAGRKPKEPGRTRVSLSTRVSDSSAQRLRALANRTGKTLGQVVDELVAFVATQPAFETLMAEFDGQDALPTTVAEAEAAAEVFQQVAEQVEASTAGIDPDRSLASELAGAIINNLPIAVAWADHDQIIRLHNTSWSSICGVQPGDLRGLSLSQALSEVCPGIDIHMSELIRAQEPHRVVIERPGEGGMVEMVFTPVRDGNGDARGFLLLTRERDGVDKHL